MEDYICMTCGHVYQAEYSGRCPKCDEYDSITLEQYNENERINDYDDYLEDRRLI